MLVLREGVRRIFSRDSRWIRNIHGRKKIWPYVSPNQYGMAVTAFTWHFRHRKSGCPTPRDSTWGRTTFGTAVASASHRCFMTSSKGSTISCSWQRQRYWTQCTVATTWGMILSAPMQQLPHPGGQGRFRIVSQERPEGWTVDSTRFHSPNVVSFKVLSGDQWMPIIGAYLPPSTLDRLPDL